MKSVGDAVERDEPLYEVSTDKVDSEMPSPATGVLTEILVEEGDTVAVGARLAVISDGDGAIASAQVTAQEVSTEVVEAPVATVSAEPPVKSEDRAAGSVGALVSPVVRRILEQAGIDPASVHGTGIGGRITRSDAESAAAAGGSRPAEASSAFIGAPVHAGRATSPTAYVSFEADFTAIDAVLSSPAAQALADSGVHLDPTVFAVRAAVEALADFPQLNAVVSSESVSVSTSRNIGVEIALDHGVAAPVVADAQDLTLRGLARRIDEVAARAKARQLEVGDLLGATFTIAAAPVGAVLLSVPSVVASQAASLGIGGIAKRPVVVETESGADALIIRSTGVLSLSYNPDIVDSHQATGFLVRVAELLGTQDWSAEL